MRARAAASESSGLEHLRQQITRTGSFSLRKAPWSEAANCLQPRKLERRRGDLASSSLSLLPNAQPARLHAYPPHHSFSSSSSSF